MSGVRYLCLDTPWRQATLAAMQRDMDALALAGGGWFDLEPRSVAQLVAATRELLTWSTPDAEIDRGQGRRIGPDAPLDD